ncbi:MAG: spore germination protein [Negativicutes bacterium]|nr:spore germination protein [Negativicutes bacterium]
MGNNVLSDLVYFLKNMLLYQPPRLPRPFVLNETVDDKGQDYLPDAKQGLETAAQELDSQLKYASELRALMEKAQVAINNQDLSRVREVAKKLKILEEQEREVEPILLSYDHDLKPIERSVSARIDENARIIKELYNLPTNKDIVMRDFIIPGPMPVKAMLIFVDGLIDKQVINQSVLKPLMKWDDLAKEISGQELLTYIVDECLPSNQAKKATMFKEVAEGLNSGDSVLFIEGVPGAAVIETKGFEHRGPERPQIEQSVRGAQAAFAEALRVNTGLIRSMMQTNDLVTEIIPVGDRIPVKCAFMYLKSVANPKLVAEVKRRIDNISTDYINDLGVLEQFIEDHPTIPFPQMLSTERVDRVTSHLAEGRVAILLDGTPFVHLVPVSFFTFFHSAEDFSIKRPMGDFMRVVRLIGTILAVILPAAYLAIIYFHQEALPTELALAIAGARERVPFPAAFEVVLMELAFELIREAGLRIPGLLGSTIGIVGALILGQAAVQANLVSPITVIIIAITGLASFTIPDYRLSSAFRVLRFGFLLLGATLGLVGVAIALLLVSVLLSSMKSFGMPYMVPIGPKTKPGFDTVLRGPVFRQEMRPDALNTRNQRRQPHISRKWITEPPAGREEE